MTTPTFADADAAIAARDYRAALSILEAIDVIGEDACYRRDIQAAACADRLGLFPLWEEYATRAHSYGDDMADPFALVARAQRRQGLIADAAATASSGARIHPTNPAIARELALAFVAGGGLNVAPVAGVLADHVEGFEDAQGRPVVAGRNRGLSVGEGGHRHADRIPTPCCCAGPRPHNPRILRSCAARRHDAH